VVQATDLLLTVQSRDAGGCIDTTRMGDRLQARILQSVFPQLAQGFLDHRQQERGPADELTEADLPELFEGTLCFFFRLLVILYAESRELLPVGDASYFPNSLRKIQTEVAEAATPYSARKTSLYDRLLGVFAAIARRDCFLGGRADPGTLFDNTPFENSAPLAGFNRAASFLASHKIADQQLALAIDELSRDPSDRARTAEFINYQCLDVRLLGSIYEAFLKVKLRFVHESPNRLAKTRNPKSGGRKPPESTPLKIRNRQVKLETNNTDRKASGSFYTPAPIVKYIVENTIGPVLAAKLEAARRKIDKAASQTKKRTQSRLKDVFDLRVIDPAMGCGHFLIEAVNFITGRLADFLNEFKEHPNPSALSRARECIHESLSTKETTDPFSPGPYHSLKQYVAERCIYGVDLDPMAVELAKVALLLEAGPSCAPVRLIDDHLACGNALVRDLPTAAQPFKFRQQGDRLQQNCDGFDCVIGNPPYVRIQNLDVELADHLRQHFETATGKFDLYIPFLELGTALLRPNGLLGMIVPNKFLTADYGAAFREFATRHGTLRQLVDFGSTTVFPDANAYCCLVFLGRRASDKVIISRGYTQPPIARESVAVPSKRFGVGPWSVRSGRVTTPVGGVPLRSQSRAIFQGLITGADRLLIGLRDGESIRFGGETVAFDPQIFRPVLKGPDVRRFALRFSNHYVLFPYRVVDERTELLSEDDLAAGHPAAYRYLEKHRRTLSERGSASMVYPAWYALWCPRTIQRFNSPKIVTQVLASRASFALDLQGTYSFVGGGNAGVYGIMPNFADEDRLWLLLAMLNSRTFDAQVQECSSHFRGGYFSYARRFIESAAIPPIQEIDLSASLPRRIIDSTKERAESDSGCHNRLEAELDDAVDELSRCGIR
jgi:type I restriction-modification system DNA methylase subunit